jgi:integrase/recombinase XerD
MKILFVIEKTRINEKGFAPIRCRLTYLKIRKIFSIGLFINPNNWNVQKQKAFPPNLDNNQINNQLSLIKQEVNQAFLMLKIQKENFDVEDIYLQYKEENTKADSLAQRVTIM